MPAVFFNARKVRSSDGVKPKVSALRTGETLLNREEAPTSYNPRHGHPPFEREREGEAYAGESARSQKPPHFYPLPSARGEVRQASQPHWLMLTITGRAFFLMCTNGESRSGRPSSRIANCFDDLLDCVNHQLRFLGLNVVRALGCD